jgi:hypothetical protein
MPEIHWHVINLSTTTNPKSPNMYILDQMHWSPRISGKPEGLHGSEGGSLSLGGACWREESWCTLDCCVLRNM